MQAENRTAKSVLILEDDLQWQTIVSQLLRKVDKDVKVRCVPTTTQAIELLNSGAAYDLIVADQFLEGQMTGLDFYRHCRTTQNSASFVMLSGLANTEFQDLVDKDGESPLFVSKSSGFDLFSKVIQAEMNLAQAATVVGGLPTARDPRAESFFLLLLTASAVAFSASQIRFTAVSLSPVSQSVSEIMNAPTQKNEILKGHGRNRVVVTPETAVASSAKPSLLLNPRLQADLKRVLSRADQINKTAVK